MDITLGPGVHIVAVTSTQLGKSPGTSSEYKIPVTLLSVTTKDYSKFDCGSIDNFHQGQVVPRTPQTWHRPFAPFLTPIASDCSKTTANKMKRAPVSTKRQEKEYVE